MQFGAASEAGAAPVRYLGIHASMAMEVTTS